MESGAWDLSFIAFNGTEKTIESRLNFPLAEKSDATVTLGNDASPIALHGDRYPIRLAPGEIKWIRLHIPQWTRTAEHASASRS
jgi:hypothetical protein